MARQRITKSLLNGLAPKTKPYEIRDTELIGFLIRVQPSGAKSFYYEWGRGLRLGLGRLGRITLVQARKAAEEAREIVRDGGDPRHRPAEEGTTEYTLRSFLGTVYEPRLTVPTAKAIIADIKHSFASLLDTKLSELSADHLAEWRAERLSAVKADTVNKNINNLQSLLSRAVEWGKIDVHPLPSIRRERVDQSATVRFLSDVERQALLGALDRREERLRDERESANAWRQTRGYALLPDLRQRAFADHLKPMVLLSLHTGLRRGELFQLRWESVDLERRNLTVTGRTAKSGKTRHVPLNDEAFVVLRTWGPKPAGLVFPGKNGKPFDNVKKAWTTLLREARIAAFRWHDMRHDFASRMVMAGVDLNTIRELLGHSDIKMTLRYAHLAPEHKMAAVAKLCA